MSDECEDVSSFTVTTENTVSGESINGCYVYSLVSPYDSGLPWYTVDGSEEDDEFVVYGSATLDDEHVCSSAREPGRIFLLLHTALVP